MKKPRIIKPSSLKLLTNLVLTELIIFGLIATLAPLANYQQLYTDNVGWRVHFYRYDIMLVIIASLGQVGATLLVFLRWESQFFTINNREISYQTGVLFITETSITIPHITAVSYAESPIQRYFHTGTIILKTAEGRKFIIKNIVAAHAWMKMIKNLIEEEIKNQTSDQDVDVAEVIATGEGALIEFKQSLRWDQHQGVANKALEKAVMKTVAAFLNSDGGRLLIGITDQGEVTGLSNDYQVIQRGDRDGFENHFTQVLKSMIDVRFRRFIRLKFQQIGEQEICLIETSPSPEPVFIKNGDVEEFYIRTGNTTSLLSLGQALNYINRRWS